MRAGSADMRRAGVIDMVVQRLARMGDMRDLSWWIVVIDVLTVLWMGACATDSCHASKPVFRTTVLP
jgi:hypothetical protein